MRGATGGRSRRVPLRGRGCVAPPRISFRNVGGTTGHDRRRVYNVIVPIGPEEAGMRS
jgi:hypothetical protein